MTMNKETLFAEVDRLMPTLIAVADQIFDYAEPGNREFRSARLLAELLIKLGFSVEMGVGGLDTAFRGEFGSEGPSFGLLCEYDALENLGHACGHHLQGPAIIGAAAALKLACAEHPCRIIVYGTPAEETTSGKVTMLRNGCFQDIDVALMMHGSPTTCTDIRCLACVNYHVTFHGKSAHAAIQPESGRSALDAMLLMFQGIEFMREHIKDDARMHYTVLDAGGPANLVPSKAVAQVILRSYHTPYLENELMPRFWDIVKGAALMSGTTYEINETKRTRGKVPVLTLNELLMNNAALVNAPRLSAPREKTGSTDLGDVMYMVPGSCIRVAFVPDGTSSHSQEYIDAGKGEAAHDAIGYGAKTLAGACYDMLTQPECLQVILAEFKRNKAE